MQNSWHIFADTLRFFAVHYPVIGGLCLAAAVGRLVQVTQKESLGVGWYWTLEVIVEGVRLFALYLIVRYSGITWDAAGIFWNVASTRWLDILAAAILFALVMGACNLSIFWLAGTTRALDTAKRLGIRAPDDKALKLALVLFVKNLTVIPFAFAWVTILIVAIAR